jgi:hypothetical protein
MHSVSHKLLGRVDGTVAGDEALMLRRTSPKVTECLEMAAEARRKHTRATDPDMKACYLQMELTWYRLANSYAFSEQVESFLRSSRLR